MQPQSRNSPIQLPLLTLLSAFLLFQVQPVISKFILPWFGGTPGVWTTCMLFFQIMLFLGYAYAHGLMKLPRRAQWMIHAVLVLSAVALLPIAPQAHWKPTGSEEPVGRILLLLLANVALPYFALSSTSPLVQVWFSRAQPEGSPWRLYALSNIGSFVALLSYPVLIEPRLDVLEQTRVWSWGFGLFAVLSLAAACKDWKLPETNSFHSDTSSLEAEPAPSFWIRVRWVLLPALASVMLLATTNHVCQDVAVIPFLWVAPLGLYLITFIVCFEHERWYKPAAWALLAIPFLLLALGYHHLPFERLGSSDAASAVCTFLKLKGTPEELLKSFWTQLGICMGAMFLACMMAHGELTRLKPSSKYLTEFYLLMSAGGALGGLLVSLVAPRIFNTFLEWPIGLISCLLLAILILARALLRLPSLTLRVSLGVLTALVVLGLPPCLEEWAFSIARREERLRNFYGSISVEKVWDEDWDSQCLKFHHGGIVHGTQLLLPKWRAEPLSYYSRNSGIGAALESIAEKEEARVGVVGMGTATSASYGRKGHYYRFYDINPDVVRIAKDRFFYVRDLEARGGRVDVILGDARLNMEREEPQHFDVLLLDAFAGDSVPVHLLTREAFEIYFRHLKPDGIIAVHVTNRYLSLAPVVQKVAESLGYKTTRVERGARSPCEYTDYVLVTNNDAFLAENPRELLGDEKKLNVPVWTDMRHDLFGILEKTNESRPR
jgi:SAM-dependent methyltransferase